MDFSFINENDLKDIKPVNNTIDTQSVDTSNDDSTDWDSYITKLANKYPDIPEKIVRGLIQRESSGDPFIDVDTKTTHGVARGLGQFIDATAKQYIPDWKGPADSYNPYKSIEGIYKYLSDLKDQHGSLNLAIQRYLGVGEDRFGTKTEDYAKQIEKLAETNPSFKKRVTPVTDFSFISENDLTDNTQTKPFVSPQKPQVAVEQPIQKQDNQSDIKNPFLASFYEGTKSAIRSLLEMPATLAAKELSNRERYFEYKKSKGKLSPENIKNVSNLLGQDKEQTEKTLSSLEKNKIIGKKEIEDLTGFAGLVQDVIGGIPQIGTSAIASRISPSIGLGMMYSQITGNTMETLRSYGISNEEASELASLNGLIQLPLEKIGLNSILKKSVKNSAPILKKLIGSAFIQEGSTEAIQQIPDDILGTMWGETKGKTLEEKTKYFIDNAPRIIKDVGYAGLVGGITGQTVKTGLDVTRKGLSLIPTQSKETPTTVSEKPQETNIKLSEELTPDDINTALELYTNPDFKDQVRKEVSALADGEQKDYITNELAKIDQEEMAIFPTSSQEESQIPSKPTETPQESKITSEPIQTTPKEETSVKEGLKIKSEIVIKPEEVTEEQWSKMSSNEKDEYFKQSQTLILNNPVTNVPGQRSHNREFNKLTDNQTKPITVAIGDVNGVKELNDVLTGMTETDKIFGLVHKYISEQFPEGTSINHLHGDEFSLLTTLPKEEVQGKLKLAMEKLANDVSIEKDGIIYKPTMSWNIGEAKNHVEVGNLNPKSLNKNEIGIASTDERSYNILKGSDNISEENLIKRGIHAENLRRRELGKGKDQTPKEGQRDLAGKTEGESENQKQQTKLEDNLTPKMKESLAKLEEKETPKKKEKTKTRAEKQREIIEKANKIRDMAKENPDVEFAPDEKNPKNVVKLGKLVEGKTHEYLAKLYDEAALKIENGITKKQTKKQEEKNKILNEFIDNKQDYTPEKEQQLIELVGSKKKYNDLFDVVPVGESLSRKQNRDIDLKVKEDLKKQNIPEKIQTDKNTFKPNPTWQKKYSDKINEEASKLVNKKIIQVKNDRIQEFERLRTGIKTTKYIDNGESTVGKTDTPNMKVDEELVEESIQLSKKIEKTENNKDNKVTIEKISDTYKEILKLFPKLKEPPQVIIGTTYKNKSGKLVRILKSEDEQAATITGVSGKKYIVINPSLSHDKSLVVLFHEMVGHYGADVVLAKLDPKLAQHGHDLFVKDATSDLMKKLKENYAEKIKRDPTALESEWLAARSEEIVNKYFGVDGKFKPEVYKADKSILSKIYDFITSITDSIYKHWVKSEPTKRELEDFNTALIHRLAEVEKIGATSTEPRLSKVSPEIGKVKRKPPEALDKAGRMKLFLSDLTKVLTSSKPVNLRILRLRYMKFFQNQLWGNTALGDSKKSYQDQLLNTINNVETFGDKYHKEAERQILEFIDWLKIKESFYKIKSVENSLNTKILGGSSNKTLKPIKEQLDKLKEKEKEFNEYITLKRLIDRTNLKQEVIKPFKKGTTESTQPSERYQGLIEKNAIKIEYNEKTKQDNYKLGDNYKEVFKELTDNLTENNKLFDNSTIEQDINSLKEQIHNLKEDIKELKENKQEEKDTIVSKIEDQLQPKKDASEKLSITKKTLNFVKEFSYRSLGNMKFVGKILDNFEKNGAFGELHIMLREGKKSGLNFKHRMRDFLSEKIKDIKDIRSYTPHFRYGIFDNLMGKERKTDYHTHTFTEVSTGKQREVDLTKSQRIDLLMKSQNDTSLRHLLEGGFTISDESPVIYKPTLKELDDMFKDMSVNEKKLTQDLFEYYKKQGEEINNISRQDIGYDIAGEDNYSPIKVKRGYIKEMLEEKDIKSLEDLRNHFTQGTPGNLKSRVRSDAPIVIEGALESLGRTSNLVEKYIGIALPSKRVNNILMNVQKTMEQKGLVPEYKVMKDMLTQSIIPFTNKGKGDNFIYALDSIFIPATLGLNVPVTLMQYVSAPLYLAKNKFDPSLMLEMVRGGSGYQKVLEKAKKYSPTIRERYEGLVQKDLFDNTGASATRGVTNVQHKGVKKYLSAEGAMMPLSWADGIVTASYWKMAEKEIKNENPKIDVNSDEFNKKVAEKVEDTLEDIQPLYDELDKSLFLNMPILRPLTYFSSQGIKNAQLLIEGGINIKNSFTEKDLSQGFKMAGKGFKKIILVGIIQSLAIETIRQSWKTLKGDDNTPEWDDVQGWLKRMSSNLISNFGIAGNLISQALSPFNARMGGPLYDGVQDAVKLIKELSITINEATQNGEFDTEKIQSLLDKLAKNTVIGYRFGDAINKIANHYLDKSFIDMIKGE